MKIILASGSPRRKELLKELLYKYNLTYDVVPSEIDESLIKDQYKEPGKLVKQLSYIKAQDIFEINKNKYDNLIVIGGDTIVYFENEFLGKPKNEEHAKNMLQRMQGKINNVYTGLTVIIKLGNKVIFDTSFKKANVYMKKINDQEIDEYIKTKEPMDKAGAYAIQGIGNKYIEKYKGKFNVVVGLDTEKIESILKKYKII